MWGVARLTCTRNAGAWMMVKDCSKKMQSWDVITWNGATEGHVKCNFNTCSAVRCCDFHVGGEWMWQWSSALEERRCTHQQIIKNGKDWSVCGLISFTASLDIQSYYRQICTLQVLKVIPSRVYLEYAVFENCQGSQDTRIISTYLTGMCGASVWPTLWNIFFLVWFEVYPSADFSTCFRF
jgi:hypothetical protein